METIENENIVKKISGYEWGLYNYVKSFELKFNTISDIDKADICVKFFFEGKSSF